MRHTFTLLFVAFWVASVSAQIALWDFNASGSAALSATSYSSNLTVSSVSFGAGVSSTGNQAASSSSPSCGTSYTSQSYNTVFNISEYWEFTLSPNSGYTVDVTQISFSVRRSDTGPTSYAVRNSVDGYINDLASGSGISVNSCLPLTANIDMTNSNNSVTFRIYFFGATSAAGTLRMDQLEVYGANTLPIELLSFTHKVEQNQIYLLWSTATELNNDYMAIERSVDGQNFSEIGRVQGAGNSVERIDYSFIDQSPYPGTNYYRLKQGDFDGTSTYHKVIAVEFMGETANTISVVQNPEEVTVQFHAPNAAGQLVLLDGMGRIIRAQKFEENVPSARISTYDLPKGFYVVQIRQIDGLIKAKSLIK